MGLRGIGFARDGRGPHEYRAAVDSVDSADLADSAHQWRRVATDIGVVADDWARATAHSAPDLSLASLVLAEMRSLAGRAENCAALIEAIATGVRRCRAQLAVLGADWVEIDTQLQSLVLLAQSVVQREMHHRKVRDEVQRTYNSAVDQWERRVTRGAAS